MAEELEDEAVLRIAGLVAEAKTDEIPTLLLRLKVLLDKYPVNSKEMRVLKRSIWKYDLLSWCAISLKYDYTKIRGGLEVAVTIADILCDCCCSLDVNESQEFSHTTLPAAVLSYLRLLRLFQQRLQDNIKAQRSRTKTDLELTEELFVNLTSLITSHPHLCSSMMNSNDLLRLVMDDSIIALRAITVIQRAIRVNRFCLSQVTSANIQALLDELVYKLTASEDVEVASRSARLIVQMSDVNNALVSVLVTRFKGLKAILGRWNGHGFDRELSRLVALLEAGSAQNALIMLQKNAISTIWAYYKGWKTRSQVKKLKHAIPTLQQSFRRKRLERKELEEGQRSARLQESEAKLEKKRSFRRTREKQLQSLEIVPAGKITSYLKDEENAAAIRIQSNWKTHIQRKSYLAERNLQKQIAAAIIIQKAVRKFLKLRKSLASSIIQEQEAMKRDRRDEILDEIRKWQAVHKRTDVTHGEAEVIHKRAQEKLVSHHRRSIVELREKQKMDSLLARIHTEQETLNHLPSLSDADKDAIDQLTSNSVIVQHAAMIEHNKQMKKMAQPWWKRLNNDNDELALEGW